jgi:hypothetical protein
MDEILFHVFLDRVSTYLDRVNTHACTCAADVHRLTGAWRALLEQHTPARRGRCSTCRSPGMCSVWRVATTWFIPTHLRPSGGG